MELTPEGPGDLRLTLVNGEERRDAGLVQRDGDAISVEIPPYRSRLVATVTDGGEGLEGRWDRDRGAGHEELLAFAAVAGTVPDRGDLLSPEDADALTGRWSVRFEDDEDLAVGVFEARADGTARGTFLTTLGDYRYLDGRFDGSRLHLGVLRRRPRVPLLGRARGRDPARRLLVAGQLPHHLDGDEGRRCGPAR